MFLVGPVVMRRCFRWNFAYQATEEGVISSSTFDGCMFYFTINASTSVHKIFNVSFGQHHCRDDVMIWEHFPCYWSFVRGIHQRIPLADIQYYRDLMCSLLSEQGVEETVVIIWGNMTLIWGHCTVIMKLELWVEFVESQMDMMTSSHGNIFRVTGPLCGKFTGPGEFPAQRPVTRSFDVFFDLRLNKRLS